MPDKNQNKTSMNQFFENHRRKIELTSLILSIVIGAVIGSLVFPIGTVVGIAVGASLGAAASGLGVGLAHLIKPDKTLSSKKQSKNEFFAFQGTTMSAFSIGCLVSGIVISFLAPQGIIAIMLLLTFGIGTAFFGGGSAFAVSESTKASQDSSEFPDVKTHTVSEALVESSKKEPAVVLESHGYSYKPLFVVANPKNEEDISATAGFNHCQM